MSNQSIGHGRKGQGPSQHPTRKERFSKTPKHRLYADCLKQFRFLALQFRPLAAEGNPSAFDRTCNTNARRQQKRIGEPLKPRQLQRLIDSASDLPAISPARYHRRACVKGGLNSGEARRHQNDDKKTEALSLAADGQSCRQIAEALSIGKSTVHRWIKDAREEPEAKPSRLDVPRSDLLAVKGKGRKSGSVFI